MRVLVGCETSGVVREAFRQVGHEAWSVDLLKSDDDSRYHIIADVLTVVDAGWDLAIFHPPCTYLSLSGWHWTARGLRDPELTVSALGLVKALMGCGIAKIAIENPVGVINSDIRLPDQVLQPYQFGHDASKRTCLWLKGLPPLVSTHFIAPKLLCCDKFLEDFSTCSICNGTSKPKKRWANQTASGQSKMGVGKWKERSRTYEGIAAAMAAQWS